MDLPTSSHFIYIPGVLILGLVLGFIWGAKATREAVVLEAKRAGERAERAQRRAERAQSKESSEERAGQPARETTGADKPV